MNNEEMYIQLRGLINQYGIPTQVSIPRYKSLLQDIFVDNPREMNLLITGLEAGVPSIIQTKLKNIPHNLIFTQIVEFLYSTRGLDYQAAMWMVNAWYYSISGIFYKLDSYKRLENNRSHPQKTSIPKPFGSTTPFPQKDQISNKKMRRQRHKDRIKQKENAVLERNPLDIPLEVEFDVSVRKGIAPLTVYFSNHSAGKINKYFWEFGDGSTSTESDPAHVFEYPGFYSVCLTLFMKDGRNRSLMKKDFVHIEPKEKMKKSHFSFLQ